MQPILLIGLTLLAVLSPLLTFASLWQVKEWRIDRLREHVEREGMFAQLLGRIRPLAIVIFLIALLLRLEESRILILLCLAVLASLTCVQIGMSRQRRPVWTKKALAITTAAACVNAVCAASLTFLLPLALPFLVLVQPLLVACAWIVFLPVDQHLKRRMFMHARRLRASHPDLTVIGVTGSVGKTTTKELIGHVLQDLHPAVTPAHVNTEMGVAQWLINILSGKLKIEDEKEVDSGKWIVESGKYGSKDPRTPHFPLSTFHFPLLVVEMGAYREGEIALMSSYVQQTHGVVTFAGGQHLALFGSEDAIFHAKSELLTHLPHNGHAYLNADNDLCKRMRELSPCPVTLVGTGGSADIEAFDIEETATGIRFRALDTEFSVPLHGTHNVTNVLLAIAVARDLGIGVPRIASLLRSFRPPSHTFSVREERGVRILDDTHNSSPASVKAAIAWARSQPIEEKVLLLSGLLELGEEQERSERDVGAMANAVFRRIIVINPRSARNVAATAGPTVELFEHGPHPIAPGSLLVCVGRMPLSTIQRVLPADDLQSNIKTPHRG